MTGPAPSGSSPMREKRGLRQGLVVGVVTLALVALIGAGVAFVLHRRSLSVAAVSDVTVTVTPTASADGTEPSPELSTAQAPTQSPTSTQDADEAARRALEELVVQDRGLHPVRGQWVAMIDSKWEGTVDPLLQAEPFTIPQILALQRSFRAEPGWGSKVRLLHNGDWGHVTNPTFMWVTIVDLDAPSREAVTSWCNVNRPGPADDPSHFCVPKQMTAH